MESIQYNVRDTLKPFVNCIMVMQESDPNAHYHLPLYADGYPGIMLQQSANGFFWMPKNKKLSNTFLYGQTLRPMALETSGCFSYVVLQLYPFASKYLLGVDPKQLNDDCFDLYQLNNDSIRALLERLQLTDQVELQIELLSDLMEMLVNLQAFTPDNRMSKAIEFIVQHKGRESIRALVAHLNTTERTMERWFRTEIGLSPKQFSKIIQFQNALGSIDTGKNKKLLEVGLDSGFSDQSHFIRVFKQYTGLTPATYLKKAYPI